MAIPSPSNLPRVLVFDQAAISGSGSDSFEHVYFGHAAFVRSVLRRLGLSVSAIDDAHQDVFVVVHRRLARFDGRHSLRSWLYAIARRVASHYRRALHRALSRQALVGQGAPDVAPGPLELAEQQERRARLSAALGALSTDKAELILLADVEERTVPEIASITGEKLSTVYTRLRRARMALRDAASACFAEVSTCES